MLWRSALRRSVVCRALFYDDAVREGEGYVLPDKAGCLPSKQRRCWDLGIVWCGVAWCSLLCRRPCAKCAPAHCPPASLALVWLIDCRVTVSVGHENQSCGIFAACDDCRVGIIAGEYGCHEVHFWSECLHENSRFGHFLADLAGKMYREYPDSTV